MVVDVLLLQLTIEICFFKALFFLKALKRSQNPETFTIESNSANQCLDLSRPWIRKPSIYNSCATVTLFLIVQRRMPMRGVQSDDAMVESENYCVEEASDSAEDAQEAICMDESDDNQTLTVQRNATQKLKVAAIV